MRHVLVGGSIESCCHDRWGEAAIKVGYKEYLRRDDFDENVRINGFKPETELGHFSSGETQ